MMTRFAALRDALSLESLLGSIDEKSGALLGELSVSRIVPGFVSSTLQRGSDVADGAPGQPLSPAVKGAVIVVGIGTAFGAAVIVRSSLEMIRWQLKLRDAKTKERAPGPRPLPILGNMPALRREYYKTLFEYVDRPAAVFWVLSTPFVVITDADCVRAVLGGSGGKYAKPKYFGYRSKAVKSAVEAEQEAVALESIDYTDGGDSSRLAMRQLVEASFPQIKRFMGALLEKIADERAYSTEDDAPYDALTSIRRALVSLNLDILFGMRDESKDIARAADMIGSAGTEFAQRMVNPLKVFVDPLGNFRYFRDVGGLISFGRGLCRRLDDTAVGESAACPHANPTEQDPASPGPSWVHAWVGKVGKIGKLGKVVGLLMASSQTVPLAAVWMLHLVSQHPNVERDLRQELQQLNLSKGADLRFDHLDKMPFVDSVVRETLRLYPPFPLVQREAQEDSVLGGITIPAKTIVYIVPWLVHRNPKLWTTPHEFVPSRFMNGKSAHGDAPSDWAYIPFGRGPRMCAGSQLAIAELKILLALTLLDYICSSREGPDAAPRPFPHLGMVPTGIDIQVRRAQGPMVDAKETYAEAAL